VVDAAVRMSIFDMMCHNGVNSAKKNLYGYPLTTASNWNDTLQARTYHTVVVASTLIRNLIHWTDTIIHGKLWEWREKSVQTSTGVLCCVERCNSTACDGWQHPATDQASTWSHLAWEAADQELPEIL